MTFCKKVPHNCRTYVVAVCDFPQKHSSEIYGRRRKAAFDNGQHILYYNKKRQVEKNHISDGGNTLSTCARYDAARSCKVEAITRGTKLLLTEHMMRKPRRNEELCLSNRFHFASVKWQCISAYEILLILQHNGQSQKQQNSVDPPRNNTNARKSVWARTAINKSPAHIDGLSKVPPSNIQHRLH